MLLNFQMVLNYLFLFSILKRLQCLLFSTQICIAHFSVYHKSQLDICDYTLPINIYLSLSLSGSDSRLRLWDIESGCNTLVNFETVRLQTNKPIQLSVSEDSALVFVPCMTVVKVYDTFLLFPYDLLGELTARLK